MRLMLASALLFSVLATPAHAALTCQQALDRPEAETVTEEEQSEFGSHIIEIDGARLSSPAFLKPALRNVEGKTLLVRGGDFSGWDFSALDVPLSNICFFESVMKRSKWDGVSHSGIGFIKTDMEAASFRNAWLDKLLLREPNLKDASMAGARLQGGQFDGGWGGSVENWDLTGADMRGFAFVCSITIGDGCPLDRTGVKFVRADLTDADISSYVFWGQADYSGAILAGTKVAPRQLPELVAASVKGSIALVGGEEKVSLSPIEVAELQRLYVEAEKAVDRPSFDCAKAGTKVETLICSEYETEMRRLDRKMAELFATLRSKNAEVSKSQMQWLAKRNTCAELDCLHQAYTDRVSAMLSMLDEPEPIKPGDVALYVHEVDKLGTSPEFRTSALYKKITPVLIGASMGEVILARNRDGSYNIVGESIGANAHICSVGGDNLRYDPKTGWFSGPREDAPGKLSAVFRIYGDQIEFPGNGHPNEEEFPGSESYAGCGMRAALVPMTRIEADAALLAKRQAAFKTERD